MLGLKRGFHPEWWLPVQALNDLFEKILLRDVPARYLLRLGMGEQELATTLDFSRVGRVNAMLARRLELLAEVPSPCCPSITRLCDCHTHFRVCLTADVLQPGQMCHCYCPTCPLPSAVWGYTGMAEG